MENGQLANAVNSNNVRHPEGAKRVEGSSTFRKGITHKILRHAAVAAAQDDAGLRLFSWIDRGSKPGRFRANVVIGPYSGAWQVSCRDRRPRQVGMADTKFVPGLGELTDVPAPLDH